ncbi:hypothetical protein MAPG_08847 [Magnaporthiopsis poae ATCC 64411]|uniref:Uncharacterized protein n=1 Tax=Magnaporthiopsis poae (strain ATCC 64411 / 73-15) TaxID=644358 RepID=A0A0C4E8E7_MAGP6|nr:hypothetical protein MAPG_08847 [Magnaporthiopsis poae ATCC 64411]
MGDVAGWLRFVLMGFAEKMVMEDMSGVGKCGTSESMGATVDDLIRHAMETRQAMRETTAPRVPRSRSRASRPDGGSDNTHRAFDGCLARDMVNFSCIALVTVCVLSGPEFLLLLNVSSADGWSKTLGLAWSATKKSKRCQQTA